MLRCETVFPKSCWRLLLLAGVIIPTAARGGEAEKAKPEFGADVQLAPLLVNGEKLSIAIHARNASDRKYAEQFAEEVVGIAYETLEKSTGAGLVIIGRAGEPHPVVVLRKFQAMAAAGQLDPAVAAKTSELTAKLADWKAIMHMDQEEIAAPEGGGFKLTFDMIVPALPLPLEGLASKLYQLSWAAGFDDTVLERKLRSLTLTDLESDALSKYDWVFYLPPRDAYVAVQDRLMKDVMKKEKIGLLKRATIRSALVVFKPAVRKAVEAMRKGMLFTTVLRARSGYTKDDIMALTVAYTQVLMPDFKFNGATEHKRALEKIEAQKARNAEYARDPFVAPARLTVFDPAAYVPFEGGYAPVEGKAMRVFKRKDDAYLWQYRENKPVVFHPASDRILVSADGKMTIGFQVDESGAVTGVEERRERYRHTFPRHVDVAGDRPSDRPTKR